MLKTLFCFFIFLFALNDNIPAQIFNLRFDHLNTESGLSNNTIQDIAEDRAGFLWIGTEDGLNRYDGYNCEVFRADWRDSNSIPNNKIKQLFVDSQGDLWVRFNVLEFVIAKYKGGGKFESIYADSILSGSEGTHLINFEDTHGNLWIAVYNPQIYQFFLYNIYSKKAELKLLPKNAIDQKIIIISSGIYDNENNILFLSDRGLLKYHPETDQFRLFSGPDGYPLSADELKKISSLNSTYGLLQNICYDSSENAFRFYSSDYVSEKQQSVRFGFIDKNDNLWTITNNNRITMYDTKAGPFSFATASRHRDIHDPVYYFCNGPLKNSVWIYSIATPEGLYSYSEGRLQNIKQNKFIPNSLAYDLISRDIFRLSDGTFAVPTEQRGLSFFNPRKNCFNYLTKVEGYSNSLSEKQVRSIIRTPVYTIIGTRDGGVNFFDESSGKNFIPNIVINNQRVRNVEALLMLNENELLLGTYKHGLIRYNIFDKSYQQIRYEPSYIESLYRKYIRKIYCDSEGTIWVCTMAGLMHFESGKNILVRANPRDTIEVPAFSICETKEGNFWVGTEHGLLHIDRRGNVLKKIVANKNSDNSLCDNVIFTTFIDSRNQLWLGTFGKGLDILNEDGITFSHISTADGLAGDVVYGILEDKEGILWISTGSGLSRFNPATRSFQNFFIEDGLPSNAFEFGAFYQTGDEIYLGTMNGVVKFNPANIKLNTIKPRINITGFYIINNQIYGDDIKDVPKIELSYEDKIFSFQYTGINFSAPERTTYKYMLEGFDENWIDAGTQRRTTFTNIPHGEYIFKVKAVNEDHIESEIAAAIPLEILPPFWVTLWFKAAIVLIALAFLFLLYRLRVIQIKKIEEIRLKIANDLHDEIGSNLGSISIMSRILKQNVDHEFLDKIHQTSVKTSSSIRDIVWFINPENNDPEKILHHIKTFCNDMLSEIEHELIIENQKSFENLGLEEKRTIYLVIKESLHNIVKYAEATRVIIKYSGDRKGFRLEIADNGNGFNKREFSGNGLKSMSKRAGEINGDLKIDSIPGEGTKIILSASTK
ncbi:MAG: hypothetical protein K9I69_05205 [Ignavibacteriales bacterium]|nr:hypothetical protein [Ignavibacteriales bacterium]MCF8306011.1 hypothetical protein [Ignavibacteriales bacterium]MCF8315733.1 hypothetical protein [Ignavibacteriales bacterium]MCF8437073.1 hypothetical protein [Ignavibacteriales bacterium]